MNSIELCRQALRSSLLPIEDQTVSGPLWPDFIDRRKPYKAWGTCEEVQHREDDEILISGPAGTGKSRACLQKFHRLAQDYPGSRFLIVRKTRTSLSESGLQTFEQWVLGLRHPMVVNGPQRKNRVAYNYPNGSQIYAGGMDKPGRIMSTEFDAVYIQEAIETTEEDLELLTTRLRNDVLPFQQIIADTNPSSPSHWIKRRCDAKQTILLESRHEDNPVLYDHDKEEWTRRGTKYLDRLDKLTGARKLRLRHGRWVQAEGVVYELWDPDIHLIPRFEIPASWRRFRSLDFGYVNPFVCGWWAIDEDKRMYLYRYIYTTKRTVKVHSADIKKYSAEDAGQMDPRIVCDHDAEDQATLRENGLKTLNARKAVSVGIEAVTERLKVQEDGRPRLFILRDSLAEVDGELEFEKKIHRVEDEFDAYVWKVGSKKEAPKDADNHGMDMARYAVMAVDKGIPSAKVMLMVTPST